METNMTAPFMRSKLMVIGLGRVGKTSLIGALLAEQFKANEQSTKGCEVQVSTIEITSKKKTWRKLKTSSDPVISHFLQALNRKTKKGKKQRVLTRRKSAPTPNGDYLSDTKVRRYGQRIMKMRGSIKSDATLGFTIYDFGGQEVFYSLHHLFLTEYGLYLIVFNAEQMLDEMNASYSEQRNYLKFWLSSKKLHAPKSPLLIVGTHCSVLSIEQLRNLSKDIEKNVLSSTDYSENYFYDTSNSFGANFQSCFHPVDSATRLGIPSLRGNIERAILAESFMHEEVDLRTLRTYDILIGSATPYISYVDATDLLISEGMSLEQRIKSVIENDEEVPFMKSKVMVLGMGQVGKTSLINALLWEKFRHHQVSTKGCDIHITSINVRNKGKRWKKGNSSGEHFISHLYQAINARQRRRKSSQKPTLILPTKQKKPTSSRLKSYGKRMLKVKEKTLGEEGLGFVIYDFGGQEVFYSLHHLFLTEYGLYLIVFNARDMLNEERDVGVQLKFLSFWLNSKRLYAPNAPMLIVGTHCDALLEKDFLRISKLIEAKALGEGKYGEQYFNDSKGYIRTGLFTCFHPVDNATNLGIQSLRESMVTCILEGGYIDEKVSLSTLQAYDILMSSGEGYISYEAAQCLLEGEGVLDTDLEATLYFLRLRGLITYFLNIDNSKNFIILQPQWLTEAITQIIFDQDFHERPQFDSSLMAEYRMFCLKGVISPDLMNNVWKRCNYTSKEQKFLIRVMRTTLLLCDYRFKEQQIKFFVPSFKKNNLAKSITPEKLSYDGLPFVLDFSGQYEKKAEYKAKFLPFGVFEKLVCILIEQSSSYEGSNEPIIDYNYAQLSFGTRLHFVMHVADNFEGEEVWIKFRMKKTTATPIVKSLIKQLFSMVKKIQDEFFTSPVLGKSNLSCKLLVPSSNETRNVLASYKQLKRFYDEKKSWSYAFHPHNKQPNVLFLKDYSAWFPAGPREQNIMAGDNLTSAVDEKIDDAFVLPKRQDWREIPPKCKYHCFLSYKQNDSMDLVGLLAAQLKALGFKCWYDQDLGDGESLNVAAMERGVKESMVYILILSDNIFDSKFVAKEASTAIKNKRKILLLHHPDTGMKDHKDFDDYKSFAPRILKPYFDEVESIPIRRRYHEKIAFLKELEKRLENILTSYSRRESKTAAPTERRSFRESFREDEDIF
eukprot:maker-scaffold_1-augustus-gene-24.20-mRNA-1 protein AED:0.41 eAED:0.41 QI:0/0/0/1/0/0/2/0/1173